MRDPAVSVVIPLYNKRLYIERTLMSVLAQTFNDFEVLVVDDGSTDEGGKIVESMVDPRIRLIRQKNAGVSTARNRGISEARAEYVAFLDGDDEWKPEFLNTVWKLHNTFQHAETFATSFEVRYPNRTRSVQHFELPYACVLSLTRYIDCCVNAGSPICSSAVMVSKHVLERIGCFPIGRARGEDLDTWFRLAAEAPIAYWNRALAVYWYNLPGSACSDCDEVREGSLLRELENGIAKGIYGQTQLEKILDYVAWHRSLTITRLIAMGEGSEARRYIRIAFRSKAFRNRCYKWYILSYFPQWAIKCARYGRKALQDLFMLKHKLFKKRRDGEIPDR